MRLRVQYTAQLRTVSGRAEDEVEVPEGSNLAELLRRVASELPLEAAPYLLTPGGELQPSLLVAVNNGAAMSCEAQSGKHRGRHYVDAARRTSERTLAEFRFTRHDVHDNYHRSPAGLRGLRIAIPRRDFSDHCPRNAMMKFAVCLILLVAGNALARAGNWPMYRRDAQRSGYTPERLPAQLSLAWSYHPLHPPSPPGRATIECGSTWRPKWSSPAICSFLAAHPTAG
jgi:hypothetical protein